MVAVTCTLLLVFFELAFGSAPADVSRMMAGRTADEASSRAAREFVGDLPLAFVANQGQEDDAVSYYGRSAGATVFFTAGGPVFAYPAGSISVRHCGNRQVVPEGRGALTGTVNLFIGNDPGLWRSGIPTFSQVVYPQVLPGIDLVYEGSRQQLKYTYSITAGSDAQQISTTYDGVEAILVDEPSGDLIIRTEWGEVRDSRPEAFQVIAGTRHDVDVRFRIVEGSRVGFEVGVYDPMHILVIDPGYSTFLGGNGDDNGHGIAVDGSGYVYVTGETSSTNFPGQSEYQSDQTGTDVFVTKIGSSGGVPSVIYSTYLGGNADDRGYGIAVDGAGNVYVTGQTDSTNFPTLNQYQGYQAGRDTFVARIDTTESGAASLIYSTYLGGNGDDEGQGIAVDGAGIAYVAGHTYSTDFPTLNQYQGEPGDGASDAFLTKIDTNQSGAGSLAYSTYLGGSEHDLGRAVAANGSGVAHVTGGTDSFNFPTLNQYQGDQAGRDVFVARIDTTQSGAASLIYSTYLGGGGNDEGQGIAVDGAGVAYVAGHTYSTDFPILNQYQGDPGDGAGDAFLTKIDTGQSGASSFVYSTYLGGSANDGGLGIAGDGAGVAYVTGYTDSTDFPILDQYQGDPGDSARDSFLTRVDTTQSGAGSLTYSTYLGGNGQDEGHDVAVDAGGNMYLTGMTSSVNFPTHDGFDTTLGGTQDAFVASFFANGGLPVQLLSFTVAAPETEPPRQ
jgi:hypothetical protein